MPEFLFQTGLTISPVVQSWIDSLDRDRELHNTDVGKEAEEGVLSPRSNRAVSSVLSSDDYQLEAIRIDVRRTFREVDIFRNDESPVSQVLFNVLCQLRNYFPDVGYCQGMNFIGGFILRHILHCYAPEDINESVLKSAEKLLFQLLVELFVSEKHDLKSMFSPGMLQMKIRIHQFDVLFENLLPDLFYHFDSIDLGGDFFATALFFPLFTNILPFEIATETFTLFIEKGWKSAFRSSFYIFNFFKEHLFNLKLERVSHFFKRDNDMFKNLEIRKDFEAGKCLKQVLYESFSVSNKQLQRLEGDFVSMKLGIDSNSNGSGSPLKSLSSLNSSFSFSFIGEYFGDDATSASKSELQEEFSNFNLITKFDSISFREKIEDAEKERQKLQRSMKRFRKKLNELEVQLDDLDQAKTSLVHQISALKQISGDGEIEKDLATMEEKMSWVDEELGEKLSLKIKLLRNMKLTTLDLEETEERKKAFSAQFLQFVNVAEETKHSRLQELRFLVE